MEGVRLVFTDIDGTVVPVGSHEVSERVRNSVVAAEERGVAVVPVTGRPFEMAQGVMDVLGFNGLCIVDGGASIRKVTSGELVWSCWLEASMLKQIASYILPHCILIDYDPEQNMRTPEQADIEAISQSAPYVYAQVHEGTAAGIVAQLNTLSDLSSHILSPLKDKPHIQEIQITHKDGNKRHGVKELLRMINVDGRQAMAIGDGDNDLPLFEEADLRIAMGNASERLKAAADHIVADVSEDGFAEAMERFVLR